MKNHIEMNILNSRNKGVYFLYVSAVLSGMNIMYNVLRINHGVMSTWI